MEIRDSAISRFEQYEGNIAHFYKDTKDKVTIGIGHMVPTADAAVSLPLTRASRPATDAQKRACWTTISGKPSGQTANSYGQFTDCRLSTTDSKALLKTRLEQDVIDLKRKFSQLDTFPWDAQDALLDMIFNLGPTRFNANAWPNLFRAVNAKDWKRAADECNRPDVQPERNQAIKALFQAAADIHLVESAVIPQIVTELGPIAEDLLVRIKDIARDDSARFFPYGISRIALAIKVDGVKLELSIDGACQDNN